MALCFLPPFPILEKQEVNGENRSELYKYLVHSDAGKGKDIKWNFEKFLVGKDGKVLSRFGSMASPGGKSMRNSIEDALK